MTTDRVLAAIDELAPYDDCPVSATHLEMTAQCGICGAEPGANSLRIEPPQKLTASEPVAVIDVTPRRAAPGKELVPIKDPLWDSQVRAILSQVHWYASTQGGTPTSPEVRRMVALDAEGRLQALVAELELRLGYVP